MSKEVLVSVIIPVYNTEDYLEECLESLVNQTLNDIEIICINDASTDKSLDILEKYANQDNRIIIINNEESKGPSIARNKGLNIAKGEYIAFCDSDDKLELDAYEKLYDFAIKNSHEVVVYNTVRFNNLDVEWPSVLHSKSILGETYTKTTFFEHPELVYDTITCNKFVNANFIRQNNIQFCENHLYEDILFSMEIFCLGKSIGICPDVKYYWRVRDNAKNSITQSVFNVKNLEDRIFITKKIIDLFKDTNHEALLAKLYVKLVEIDILQFINELDVCSDDFKQIMFDEVKECAKNLPKNSFNAINDFDNLKYDLFIRGDEDTLITLIAKERLDTSKQKELNVKVVEFGNTILKKNKKIKKQKEKINKLKQSKNKLKTKNNNLKSKNKKLKQENAKLKTDLNYLKSFAGWIKYKIKNVM